eukprot:scaffold178183_cov34-Prasinocladus_malaysianus.AAC.2
MTSTAASYHCFISSITITTSVESYSAVVARLLLIVPRSARRPSFYFCRSHDERRQQIDHQHYYY